MDWEHISKYLKAQGWVILLVLGSLSFFFMSPDFTLGVVLGGLIIIANFSALQSSIRSAFTPEGTMLNKKNAIVTKYYLRLAILGIIIYILVTTKIVSVLGLVVGLSIIVINILILGIRFAIKISSGEAV